MACTLGVWPATCGSDPKRADLTPGCPFHPGGPLSLRWWRGDCERAYRGGGRRDRGGRGSRARSGRVAADPALARAHAAARRARARALQAGQAAGLVLHLQGERGRVGRRGGRHGAGRPRRAAAPQPRPAPLPRRRAVARALPVHGPCRGHDERPRLEPAHPGRERRASASSPGPRTCRRSCRSPSARRWRSACAASRAWRSAGSATARRPTGRRTSR